MLFDYFFVCGSGFPTNCVCFYLRRMVDALDARTQKSKSMCMKVSRLYLLYPGIPYINLGILADPSKFNSDPVGAIPRFGSESRDFVFTYGT